MFGALPANLVLSLIFGVGQIAVGGWLAWYELAPRKWRSWRAVVVGAVGVWFFVSGVCELIVSGMEVSRITDGGPSLVTFNTTRAAADGALFALTVALALGLAVYLVVWWVWTRRVGRAAESERGQ
jgi:hypothetical protein